MSVAAMPRVLALLCGLLVAAVPARAQVIERVEFVQTTQTLQPLADLLKSLNDTGQPPMAMLAGKVAALRVYTVAGRGAFTLGFMLPGNAREQRSQVTLGAATVDQQRFGSGGSVPATAVQTFVVPEGDWSVTLRALDSKDKVVQGPIEFKFKKSPRQRELSVALVFVCDAKDGTGKWLCPSPRSVSAAALRPYLSYIEDLLPTHKLGWSHEKRFQIELERSKFVSAAGWFSAVLKEIAKEAEAAEKKDAAPPAPDVLRFYLGLARSEVKGDIAGMAGSIPSRTALALAETSDLGTPDTPETWAHEIGHGLNLRHTDTDLPKAAGGRPPGCYLKARDPGNYWAKDGFADNRVQSAPGTVEIGYRPRTKVIVKSGANADNMMDLMGYCLPQWISPPHIARAATLLAVGGPTPPLARAAAAAGPAGFTHWFVSGAIGNGGQANIDPLFFTTLAQPASSSGDHLIRIQDASGFVLLEQAVEMRLPILEKPTSDALTAQPYFHALVPVVARAARLVIVDPAGREIGERLFSGQAPQVTVLSPSGASLSGVQQVLWSAVSGSGQPLSYRVEYSADGGGHWHAFGPLTDSQLMLDLDDLPGGAGALLRVQASDGAEIGVGNSAMFSVLKKAPAEAVIGSPPAAAVFGPDDAVLLAGGAYDGDDGILQGAALAWSSSIDGALGTGQSLALPRLSPGRHLLTLSGQDSDGNPVVARTRVDVAAGPPRLLITLNRMSQQCTATVHVLPDRHAALVEAAVSSDGGASYLALNLDALPFALPLAGTGTVQLVARALDLAGQLGSATLAVDLRRCRPQEAQ